MNRTLPWK